jgi:DNA invertase Pin-like site-specific DNA recombinase
MGIIEKLRIRGLLPKAAVYARFSSDNQREESIDAQLRAIREYAKNNGIIIVAEYVDKARSATTDDRPQFLQMVEDSKQDRFNLLMVHKLDRFARNRQDSIGYRMELKRNGVSLISVLEYLDEDSPESVILESVLEAMAEYYSKNLAREVKKGMKENALQCISTGGRPPFGYLLNPDTRRYEVNEDEAPAVRLIIEQALRNAEAMGCALAEVSLPHTEYAIADYYIIAPAEASSNLARYDAVRYGYRAPDPEDLADMYLRSRSAGFGPEVKRRIMIGTYALSSGYYEAYYGRAMRVRTLIKQDFERAFAEVDALLAPVSPTPAFKLGERTDDPLAMYLSDIYTVTANLAGIPALSLPCGFTPEGLPVGLQILASQFKEATILRFAHAYAQAFPVDSIATKS